MEFVLESVEKANTRVSSGVQTKRGQNFEFRFRSFVSKKSGDDSRFFISDAIWEKLNLDNKGLKQMNIKADKSAPISAVWLAVVENDEAVLLKKTNKSSNGKKKGRNFKSSILEVALSQSGVLDLTEASKGKNQLLKLVEVEHGGKTYFNIVKDVEGQAKFDSDEKEEQDNAPVAEVPAASPVAASDDNDL